MTGANGEAPREREGEVIEAGVVPTSDLQADLAIRPEFAGLETMEAMERRAEIMGVLLERAVRKTSSRHWLNYGDIPSGPNAGKPTDPRPEDEAAVVIARELGVSWVWLPRGEGAADWIERPKANGASEIIVTVRGHCFGQIIEEVGSCSTDDGLLKSSKRADTRGSVALFSDVLKKARANALVRLLQAFGLRAVTWEDLEAAGIKRQDCDRVEFAESEEAAAKSAARTAAKGVVCPKCGAGMRPRTGSHGPFLGCTKYPACTGTRQPEGVPGEKPQEAAPGPQTAPPPGDTPKAANEAPAASGEAGKAEEASTSQGAAATASDGGIWGEDPEEARHDWILLDELRDTVRARLLSVFTPEGGRADAKRAKAWLQKQVGAEKAGDMDKTECEGVIFLLRETANGGLANWSG